MLQKCNIPTFQLHGKWASCNWVWLHFCSPNNFVLPTNLSSQHFWASNTFELPTLLSSHQFCTPNIFRLPSQSWATSVNTLQLRSSSAQARLRVWPVWNASLYSGYSFSVVRRTVQHNYLNTEGTLNTEVISKKWLHNPNLCYTTIVFYWVGHEGKIMWTMKNRDKWRANWGVLLCLSNSLLFILSISPLSLCPTSLLPSRKSTMLQYPKDIWDWPDLLCRWRPLYVLQMICITCTYTVLGSF